MAAYARIIEAQNRIAASRTRAGVTDAEIDAALDACEPPDPESLSPRDLYLTAIESFVAALGGRLDGTSAVFGDETVDLPAPSSAESWSILTLFPSRSTTAPRGAAIGRASVTGRHVERRVAVKEPDGLEPEGDGVHRHDRPLLGAGDVVDPEDVPEDDVGVLDGAVRPPSTPAGRGRRGSGRRTRRTASAPPRQTASPTACGPGPGRGAAPASRRRASPGSSRRARACSPPGRPGRCARRG